MTETSDSRIRLIAAAGWIALGGNLVLALLKLVLGSLTGSLAVVGDGIDSCTDVAIAIMALVVSRVVARPSDKNHPWGHGRAETTATMLLSFIIGFAGLQLALSSVEMLLEGSHAEPPAAAALMAALISIGGKLLLALSQLVLGKRSGSAMILANAQNMRNDVIMSAAVLAGVACSRFFSLPLLDPLVALLVSIWVMKNAVSIFLDMNMELMDGNEDNELYRKLFAAIKTVDGASNPHRARIRKLANYWDINVDIEVDAALSVHEAHSIAERTEQAVRRAIPDIYDIMVHIEPAGHSGHHPREQYGLSERDLL